MTLPDTPLLETIRGPADLRSLGFEELEELATEIRHLIVATVTRNGGHLGSNLGIVELTLALHRVFRSPHDAILFDTGHQAYPHKLLTGRRRQFSTLRLPDGMSGYPSRAESEHDWIENSHASTALSYSHGLAAAFRAGGDDRRVVAVVGDGSLTGGMALEGLNNIGHSSADVTIILNDNGRSYAPTISRLSESLIKLTDHLRLRARAGRSPLDRRVDSMGGGPGEPWHRRHRGGHPADVGTAPDLRAVRHPLLRAVQRPRSARTRTHPQERPGDDRSHRGACDHPEGPRLRPRRERSRQGHA